MTRLFRGVFQLSWVLGVLSIAFAIVVKFAHLEPRVGVTAHTLFLVAAAFFLCALATREMERSASG
jgi:multidrug transporter EmrE-like cation transporter